MKNLSNVKTFSMVILSLSFLALAYWPSNSPKNAIFNVSSWQGNSSFCVTKRLISSILVYTEIWKLVDFYWQIKPLCFPRIRVLTVRKIQKMVMLFIYLGIQSHLRPQLQTSCLPPRWQSNCFPFWGVFELLTIFSIPCNWLVIVQKSQFFSVWNLLDFQSQVSP